MSKTDWGEGGQGHFWTMSKSKRLFFRMSSLNQSNNHGGDRGTAPATPGLLKIEAFETKKKFKAFLGTKLRTRGKVS